MTYTLEGRIEELLGESRSHGVNRSYRCPFHEERRPSFSINMDEGLWVCFGCGLRGNYEQLCTRLGTAPDNEYRWLKAQKIASSEFHQPPDLRDRLEGYQRIEGEDATKSGGRGSTRTTLGDFLHERSIRPESARVYEVVELGGRIAFPYIDVDGRVTGIKYRDARGNKYAEDGSEFGLYGVVLGVGYDDVIVCEGESDTLRTHSETFGKGIGVCGTSGASVSEPQWTSFGLHFLFSKRIFLAYDADEAGDKCAESALRVLGDERCIRLRPTRGKDITEHLQRGGSLREMVQ
jgi:DNA primase